MIVQVTKEFTHNCNVGVGVAVGLSVLGVCILISVVLVLLFIWRGKKKHHLMCSLILLTMTNHTP